MICSVIQFLPKCRAEAAGHVLPQVVTVHGAYKHVHCFDDLWCVLVLFDFSVYRGKKKIPHLLLSIVNWHGYISGRRWIFILRGQLVARKATAGYGFLSQHLPAIAVEGSDHLQ